MAATLKLLELESACAVCGARADDLQQLEELDAELGRGETPLQTKLLALSQNKTVPSGGICGGCVRRATDAWSFQQQLQAAQAEPSLSDKIRVLRQRLRELTQKIDVFIVIGPEKTDGQPVYTEDNIIMVDKNMLQDLDEEDDETTKNDKGERVYQCSVCPESFPKLSDYMEHTRLHPADSLHTCWTCGKQFSSRDTLKTHRAHHLDIDKLACKLCNQLFQGQVEMKRHSCEPRCPSCGELSANRAALGEHVRAQHGASGTPPYVCAICMESFTLSDKLLAHVVKHRQTKQFVCGYEGCVLRFATRNNLMSHIRKLHATASSLRCTAAGCEETFRTAEQLRVHTANEHVNRLQCPICNKVLQTQGALRKHLKSHERAPLPRGRPKKVKTELVEQYQEDEAAGAEEAEEAETDVLGAAEAETAAEDYEVDYGGVEHHTVLIEQEQLPEGEYQLECVAGEEMAVEMLEEEVEYLEVETLEEEIEEDLKPDLGGL